MDTSVNYSRIDLPEHYQSILDETRATGFDQLSDIQTGSLLESLCASKPAGQFLELGTGSGLSTTWMLRGMCAQSKLSSVDNNVQLTDIAKKYLEKDSRVEFFVEDGEHLIERTQPGTIDLIFADTWPGKYYCLEETLALLKPGGLYVIDDMLPQPNWPEGHHAKAQQLADTMQGHKDFATTWIHYSTGIMIATKRC